MKHRASSSGTRPWLLSVVVAAAAALAPACGEPTPVGVAAADGRVAVNVAPLGLPALGDVAYRVRVVRAGGGVVVDQAVRAASYGTARGDLSYVAPCDAAGNPNRVELAIEALYDEQLREIPVGEWASPTAAEPLSQPLDCVADGDVAVTFDVTVLRSAKQGFFDVAVTFSDIFCSAKLDCEHDLLHGPGGERGPTAILAFACTTGDGETTWLHMSDLEVTCASGPPTWVLPAGPGGQAGNMGPAGDLFQTAAYWGREAFPQLDQCYWNVALGLGDLGPDCVLRAQATATRGPLDGERTPENSVYPYVSWEVALTDLEGAVQCGTHALNAPRSGVSTAYTAPSGGVFATSLRCDAPPVVSSAPRQACSGVIGAIGGAEPVTINPTVEGVSVTVGDARSPGYKLPAGFNVGGCCLNSCCTE